MSTNPGLSGSPYLEKLSKELGPHAAKVQQLISAVN